MQRSKHSEGWFSHTEPNYRWAFEHVKGVCTLDAQNVDHVWKEKPGLTFGGKYQVDAGGLSSNGEWELDPPLQPETKEQSRQWKHKKSPQPQKFKVQSSANKIMCTISYDTKDVVWW